MILLNDDERAKWWESFARWRSMQSANDPIFCETQADRDVEAYRSRLPKTEPADALPSKQWPTIEALLAYDDDRTVPASEDIRFALECIWDKPHRAPLYLADLLEASREVSEPAPVQDPAEADRQHNTKVIAAIGQEVDQVIAARSMSEVLAELDAEADLPPDHPRKQLEDTLEINRAAFESLPPWARNACSTGEVFAPQVDARTRVLTMSTCELRRLRDYAADTSESGSSAADVLLREIDALNEALDALDALDAKAAPAQLTPAALAVIEEIGACMFAPANAEARDSMVDRWTARMRVALKAPAPAPLETARDWAQNSADNDGRRYLAVAMRKHGPEAYAAACVLADLGPDGSDTSRADRESSLKILIKSMRTATGEVLSLHVVTDVDGVKMLRGRRVAGFADELTTLMFIADGLEAGTVVEVRSAKS